MDLIIPDAQYLLVLATLMTLVASMDTLIYLCAMLDCYALRILIMRAFKKPTEIPEWLDRLNRLAYYAFLESIRRKKFY